MRGKTNTVGGWESGAGAVEHRLKQDLPRVRETGLDGCSQINVDVGERGLISNLG